MTPWKYGEIYGSAARLAHIDAMTTRTIFLAVPTGESVRNVLRTETFAVLRDSGARIVLLSQGADDGDFREEFGGRNVEFRALQPFEPYRIERLLSVVRFALAFRLTSTAQVFAQHWANFRRIVPIANVLNRLLGRSRARRLVDWLSIRAIPGDAYGALIEEYQPDLIVVSRALNFSADYPLLRSAVRRKVPVAALVSSWDNFTSKGFIGLGLSAVVVWNDIMRDEAFHIFGIPAERILVSGIPRFDDYFRREPRSRIEFCRELGIDPSKKLVTYTTSQSRLFEPYESENPELTIIRFLADAVERGELGPNVQLLVRLHPSFEPEALGSLAEDARLVLHAPGRLSAFRDRDLSTRENQLLAETMFHSDVVVNIASTITIDAAVFDTPSVCIAFDARGERPYGHSVRRFYDFEHYRKLAPLVGFRLARSPAVLLDEIRTYLADPARDREGRRKIVQSQCYQTDGHSGARVGRFILDLAERTASSADSAEVSVAAGSA